MKFCKNLQKVIDVSDPEWCPFWLNYKMLKKIIKELSPPNPDGSSSSDAENDSDEDDEASDDDEHEDDEIDAGELIDSPKVILKKMEEKRAKEIVKGVEPLSTIIPITANDESPPPDQELPLPLPQSPPQISQSPGEITFFKFLHSEIKKSTHFLSRIQCEYSIRLERQKESLIYNTLTLPLPTRLTANTTATAAAAITTTSKIPPTITESTDQTNTNAPPREIIVGPKNRYQLLTSSTYKLYKDLLLLENYCIMTYCSISKILKKHDKYTGFNTRSDFMRNVVNKQNFTAYNLVGRLILGVGVVFEEVQKKMEEESRARVKLQPVLASASASEGKGKGGEVYGDFPKEIGGLTSASVRSGVMSNGSVVGGGVVPAIGGLGEGERRSLLQRDERLFIEMIMRLNRQVGRVRVEEEVVGEGEVVTGSGKAEGKGKREMSDEVEEKVEEKEEDNSSNTNLNSRPKRTNKKVKV